MALEYVDGDVVAELVSELGLRQFSPRETQVLHGDVPSQEIFFVAQALQACRPRPRALRKSGSGFDPRFGQMMLCLWRASLLE